MKGTKPQLVVDNGALENVPPSPSWFSDHAKQEWRRCLPGLIERGIVTEADIASLENYCVCQGRVRELEAQIQAVNDMKTKAQLWRAQDKAMATARQHAAELGLTPISRSRPAQKNFLDDLDDPLDIS